MVRQTLGRATIAVVATTLMLYIFELGRRLGRAESSDLHLQRLRASTRQAANCSGHPAKLYGHVHMAKTGGTSLNGILANRYERVCGNKGDSMYAYQENEVAASIKAKKGTVRFGNLRNNMTRGKPEDIGWEDCDYVSAEVGAGWWIQKFGDGRFHGYEMELHVPCRDPVDHLMSLCNHGVKKKRTTLKCNATTDDEYFSSVEECLRWNGRFHPKLHEHFDVKCFAFKWQFTLYVDLMGGILQDRRISAEHFTKRETNQPRDKDKECIWSRPELLEKTRKYLLDHSPYYSFCNECIGTEDDITLAAHERGKKDDLLVNNSLQEKWVADDDNGGTDDSVDEED